MTELVLTEGSPDWKRLRKLCTESIPGKRSALYTLNDLVLGKGPLVPMTYRAHLGMCLFAEGMTGIPEIDEARVKLILVARGIGKTSLITKGLPLLRVIQNPDFATGIANEVAEMAESFLGDIKAELENNELLRLLFPEIIPPDFRSTTWKADRIITKREKQNPSSPTIIATGVGGTKTGIHQNLWIGDDLLSKNAAEALRRGITSETESTNQWIVQLQPLLKNPKRDPLVFIGTFWWEGDSYSFIEEFFGHGEEPIKRLWKLNLPAQNSVWTDGSTEKVIKRPPETQILELVRRGEVAIFKLPARDEAGRAVFPERYNEEELRIMEEEDPVFFAGQYLLEPTAGAAAYFNKEWLKEYEWDGTSIRYTNKEGRITHQPIRDLKILQSVDPAFSKKASAARSALPVVGTDGANLFLLEDTAERMDSEDDIAARVAGDFLKYRTHKIFVETIVAQVVIANAIRRRFREMGLGEAPIEEIPSHGKQKKNLRVYGLESFFKRGMFYYHRGQTNFLREYLSFPRAALKDILDALSFQTDEWDKIFALTHFTGGDKDRTKADQEAIARIKRVRAGRRRR